MIRKTCCALIPFQVGLLLAFMLGKGAVYLLPFTATAGVLVFCSFKGARAYAAVISISFCAGAAVSCAYTSLVYDKTVAFDGQRVSVKGYVYDMKEYESGACFLTVSGRINDSVSGRLSFFVTREELACLSYGEEVTVTGNVSKISDSYLKANGVFLQGQRALSIASSGKRSHILLALSKRLRDYAYERLCVHGEGGKTLGAMLCGDRSELDDEASDVFYITGVGHIFAFSGTHIAIMITAASVVLEALHRDRRLCVILLTTLAWGLVLFSGLAVSAIRAAVMVSLLLLSKLSKHRSDPLTSLSVAGFFITLFSPYCVASASFLLSFTGSFACSAYSDFLCERLSYDDEFPIVGFKKSVISVFCAGLIIMPVCAFTFEQVSIISPLVNLIMLPVFSVCLVLSVIGVIIGAVSGAASSGILWAASLVMKGAMTILGALARLPFAYADTNTAPLKAVMIIISVLPAVVLLLHSRKRLLFELYLIAAAAMAVISYTSGAAGGEEYTKIYLQTCEIGVVTQGKKVYNSS